MPRSIKSAYRREPIISTIVTMGLVDVLIGGFQGQVPLLALGLIGAGGAIAFRLLTRRHQSSLAAPPNPPLRALPSQSSRPQMPMLGLSHRPPPPH
ncbi:MAG: hypothetical protein AAF215_11125 [Cyanobacteria bacterium P01_A01_bin.123]